MKVKSMFACVAMVGLASSCGGGGESESSAPDININVEIVEIVGPDVPMDNIVATALPILENFDTANSIEGFLASSYKALATESATEMEDGFYYATGGVYQTDGTLDPARGMWITADSDAKIRLGNGRFTLGQIVSVLASGDDLRRNSTPGGGVDELVSWGELDLSQAYRVSFCLVAASAGGNMQVYTDNNSTSSAGSIHGSSSRIFSEPVGSLAVGQRQVIETDVGTEQSFIQFRVDSGGWAVLDDLVVEYQSDNNGASQPDCTTKTTDFSENMTGEVEPEPVTGTAFTGIPASGSFDVDFSVGTDNFFATAAATDFLAISNNINDAFYKVTSGSSGIAIADSKLSMANARFTVGDVGSASAAATAPEGDLNFSAPYRITLVISDFTDANAADDPGKFQVYIDNNTSSSGNSLHGGASKVVEIAVGDGTITSLPHTLVIEPTIGTANSFIQLRADSRIGNITIDSISIEYTGAAPVNDDVILSEDFSAVDTADFMSEVYKALPTDPATPLYEATSGGSRIALSDGALAMTNARFTVGSSDNTVASAAAVAPLGTLDLSNAYTLRFTVVNFTDDADTTNDSGKFQVYVDNNTTSSSNSIHEGASKVLEIAVNDGTITTLPHTVTLNLDVGTATSFLQFRADSRVGTLVIDDLSIEYQ